MKIATYILYSILFVSFAGCERFVLPENETSISKFTEDESHEFGKNCMDCHYSAGRGEGWFTLAGSVGGNANLASIELIDTVNGLVKNIEVDKHHNFYTTEVIDFSTGLKVGIRSETGEIKYMNDHITVGQCNLCHGATALNLSVDW